MEHSPLLAQSGQATGDSKSYIWSLLHISSAFFLVFTAFSGIQNVESSLIEVPHVGFISIAVLYFVFTLSCLVTPALVSIWGPRWSVTIAFVCFVLFCLANVLVVRDPDNAALAWGGLITGGSLTGFAASFLWTAQGAYITACAYNYARACGKPVKSALGLFSGIFFGIFQLTQISGNLLESIILKFTSSSILFVVYMSCAALGTLLAAFLRPVKDAPTSAAALDDKDEEDAEDGEYRPPARSSSFKIESGDAPEAKKEETGLVELLSRTVRLWANPKMLLLIPLLFLSGLEQGWVFGDYTKVFIAPSIGEDNIGYVMTCFGVVDALGSFALGKLSDVVGRPPILVLGFLCQTAVTIILLIVDVAKDDWSLLIVCAGLWGLGDAAWNTQISAILGDLFEDNLEGAFANFKLFQSLLMGTAFLLGSVLLTEPKLYLVILLILLVISTICVLSALFIHKKQKD